MLPCLPLPEPTRKKRAATSGADRNGQHGNIRQTPPRRLRTRKPSVPIDSPCALSPCALVKLFSCVPPYGLAGLRCVPVPRSATNSRRNNNKERQERNGEKEEGQRTQRAAPPARRGDMCAASLATTHALLPFCAAPLAALLLCASVRVSLRVHSWPWPLPFLAASGAPVCPIAASVLPPPLCCVVLSACAAMRLCAALVLWSGVACGCVACRVVSCCVVCGVLCGEETRNINALCQERSAMRTTRRNKGNKEDVRAQELRTACRLFSFLPLSLPSVPSFVRRAVALVLVLVDCSGALDSASVIAGCIPVSSFQLFVKLKPKAKMPCLARHDVRLETKGIQKESGYFRGIGVIRVITRLNPTSRIRFRFCIRSHSPLARIEFVLLVRWIFPTPTS